MKVKKKRLFTLILLCGTMMSSVWAAQATNAAEKDTNHEVVTLANKAQIELQTNKTTITQATAIGHVYGDGEKVGSIILTYKEPIRATSVSATDYSVQGRTVTAATVVSHDDGTESQTDASPYVALSLAPLPMVAQGTEGPQNNTTDPHPEEHKTDHSPMQGGGPKLGSSGNPQPLPTLTATVSQIGLVQTQSGTWLGPVQNIQTTETKEPIVDDFIQDVFVDDEQHATLKYNLYIPKNYDPNKKYPLVVFMHDAGTVSPEVKSTLVQGLGAITFADEAWQAAHPSFVLAPQYDTIIVNDQYQYGPELERTVHLIQKLESQYSIDPDRIYNTGQSMGGMAATQLDISYPHMFAGSYIVAAKWNPAITSPLGNQNIIAIVSANDPGAKPSFDTIMKQLAADHHTVITQKIDPATDLETAIKTVGATFTPDSHLYYFILEGGNHRSTWQYAYSLKPALEWLFSQVRK